MIDCIINNVTSDRFWFSALQSMILLVLLFALFKDFTRAKNMTIKRGEKSREIFTVWASAIIALLISVVFEITTFPEKNKVFFYMLDLSAVSYLCFYNSWFTNRLVSLKASFENREY